MKRKSFLAGLAAAALLVFLLALPYANGGHRSHIIRLVHLLEPVMTGGMVEYRDIYQEGAAILERVLMVGTKGTPYMDDGVGADGTYFVFYYIDSVAGMKALISSAPLDGVIPSEELTPEALLFREDVLREIERDGGAERVFWKLLKDGKGVEA